MDLTELAAAIASLGESPFDGRLDRALAAAGFPAGPGLAARPILRVRDLSPDQRAAAELLAGAPRVPTGHPFPSAPWAIRRWLDGAGPLFGGDDPLFHRLRADARGARALLAGLPARTRAEVLVDLLRLASDHDLRLDALPAETAGELGADAHAWAVDVADTVLADPTAFTRAAYLDARRLVFAALVAGGPIAPRHDALLPLEPRMPPAWLAAIPAPRREAALARALGWMPFPHEAVWVATELLPDHPYPAVAEHILWHLAEASWPGDAMAAVERAAERVPAIATLLRRHAAALAAPALRIAASYTVEDIADLGDVRLRQLEVCARLYDGTVASAAELLARPPDGDGFQPATIELLVLHDPVQGPAYDAWLFNFESGVIFAAGTTTVVAQRIQMSLDGVGGPLRAALEAVLPEGWHVPPR